MACQSFIILDYRIPETPWQFLLSSPGQSLHPAPPFSPSYHQPPSTQPSRHTTFVLFQSPRRSSCTPVRPFPSIEPPSTKPTRNTPPARAPNQASGDHHSTRSAMDSPHGPPSSPLKTRPHTNNTVVSSKMNINLPRLPKRSSSRN